MKTVLLDQQTFSDKVNFNAIQQIVSSFVCYKTTKANDIIERCQDAEIVITNKVVLTEGILKALPKLKLICIAATGTNNVDLSAAKQLGIAVTNVTGYGNNSVAQYVLSQIIEDYSNTHHHHENTEKGLWQQSPTFCYHGNGSTELAGKTLGIIGYGCLGKSIAKLAEAFEMKVLIAEHKGKTEIRAGYHPFNEVVEQADIISLHCPQTPETEHLVNADFLQRMKPTAILINSARGALIDNKALLVALKDHSIRLAVLDVLDQEPPPADHILLTSNLSNLKITAHIAWASIEAQQRLLNILADNILSFINDGQANRVI